MKRQITILTLAAGFGIGALIVNADDKKPEKTEPAKETTQTDAQTVEDQKIEKVKKTDEEWQKELTPEQFRVARKAGTERPFGKAYDIFHIEGEGTYYCICCDAELFTSNEKFDSGCGWPSFYDESKAKNIGEKVDMSGGTKRTEVICKKCDAHLGHVFFNEGFDNPTNKRYCINAVSIKFLDAKAAAAKRKADSKKSEKSEKKEAAEKTQKSDE